ncbi:MAG TPA: twin-arginine translocation signal domain-containing protein, partial [Bryobacteraceae bacterium]
MATTLTRRTFLQTGAAAAGAVALSAQTEKPKRLAIICTVYRYLSHAQHMGDRFLVGYPHEGEWHKPNMQVVSLYVDQKPEGDLSGERAREFGFKVYPTIAEALRCGGTTLAVDAVLIIGEHGDYPRNELG